MYRIDYEDSCNIVWVWLSSNQGRWKPVTPHWVFYCCYRCKHALTCQYRADAASIGPVQARYWQLMVCLQGIWWLIRHTLCIFVVYLLADYLTHDFPMSAVVRTDLSVWIFPRECVWCSRVWRQNRTVGTTHICVAQYWVVSTIWLHTRTSFGNIHTDKSDRTSVRGLWEWQEMSLVVSSHIVAVIQACSCDDNQYIGAFILMKCILPHRIVSVCLG